MRLRLSAPIALVSALLLGALLQPAPASAATRLPIFGSSTQMQEGERLPQTIARYEGNIGRLGAVRLFQTVPKPSAFDDLGSRNGIISFRLPPGEVLSGRYDRDFRAFFAAAPRDHRTFWSYYHEADVAYQHHALNDLAQFRAAYTRVARLARAAGNPQLRTTVILVGWTANPKSGLKVSQFMPAAGLTDLVAWDNYNSWFQHNDQGYGDPSGMVEYDRAAAASVGLPFAVAEFGSTLTTRGGVPDLAGRAAWITRFCREAASRGAVFVSYFDHVTPGAADYRLLDAPSRQAYRAVVSDQDPF